MSVGRELTDLDALCAPAHKVRAGGREWKVPGAPPLEWLLAFRTLEENLEKEDDGGDELAMVERLRDHLVRLFLIHQPRDEQKIRIALDNLDVTVILVAVRAIYAGQAEDVEPDPPKRPAGTKSGTSRPKASRSRSSS